jgi:RNA polymerase sigma-70 factor (ECF subfamily)
MTESEFAVIVGETKSVVLSAVEKHLFARFYHAIDDVVQETYLRAYRGLQKNQFEGRSQLSTWLYTIARNESNRMNEKLGREERKISKLQQNENAERPAEPRPGIGEEMLGWIRQLPAQYMNVVKLALGGFSEKEIAASLSISPGTVKSRSHRARGMLRRIIEREGHGNSTAI